MTPQERTQTGLYRCAHLHQYLSFDSRFEQGLDRSRWHDEGYPWIVDDSPLWGHQETLYEESQYYLRDAEQIPYAPCKLRFVNKAGHLVLRCMPTPAPYQGMAYGVVDDYTILAVHPGGSFLTVAGKPYRDVFEKKQRVGINRRLVFDPTYRGWGMAQVEGSCQRYNILTIKDMKRSNADTGRDTDSHHEIEISGQIDNLDSIVSGKTRVRIFRAQKYVSAMLSTRGAYSQRFGSWHFRCRVPAGRGTLAGVMLMPSFTARQRDSHHLVDRCSSLTLFEQPGHGEKSYLGVHVPLAKEGDSPDAVLPRSLRAPDIGDEAHDVYQPLINPLTGQSVDARGQWQEIVFDWYPDGRAVWYLKAGDEFVKIAQISMPDSLQSSADGELVVVLKNAFGSWRNHRCEHRDQVQARNKATRSMFQLQTSPPWDFEIDFLRVYQWERCLPNINQLPVRHVEGDMRHSVTLKAVTA